MSPSAYNGSVASVLIVNSNGILSNSGVNDPRGLRPVINLRADTNFTGSGSSNDPFVVAN